MDRESMTEIIGKRKVDETTRLKCGKIYIEKIEFEEKIKKINEDIIKYSETRKDLWEYDKQNLLEFCWQYVLDKHETDIEIILNKFRDFNGKYKMAKEKKSKLYTYMKEKTKELAESYGVFCWKKESSNENDDDKNEIEEKWLGVINLDKIDVKDAGIKIKKKKGNNNMTIWDYISLTFLIILATICWVFLIWFFIFAIKTLFEHSSWEINLNNPTNSRRMGKIIAGIFAIVLFICKSIWR